MIINVPEETYTIDQYDFLMSNGTTIQMSIDRRKDSISFEDTHVVIAKAAGDIMGRAFPPETVVIRLEHVMIISHREREVTLPAQESSLELS